MSISAATNRRPRGPGSTPGGRPATRAGATGVDWSDAICRLLVRLPPASSMPLTSASVGGIERDGDALPELQHAVQRYRSGLPRPQKLAPATGTGPQHVRPVGGVQVGHD